MIWVSKSSDILGASSLHAVCFLLLYTCLLYLYELCVHIYAMHECLKDCLWGAYICANGMYGGGSQGFGHHY